LVFLDPKRLEKDLTELPGLIAGIKDFYAGNHAEPADF